MNRSTTRFARRGTLRFIGGATAAVTAISLGGATSTAQPTPVYEDFGYDCVAVIAIVSIPSDRAAAALPAGYRSESLLGMLASSGLPGPAQLTLQTATCQHGTFGGVPVARYSESVRALAIQPPDKAPGHHLYNYDFVIDNHRAVDVFQGSGLTARFGEGLSGEKVDGIGVGEGGDIHLRVTSLAPSPIPLTNTNVWHRSDRGTGLLRGQQSNSRGEIGVGCVTADPGSSVAELLGSTSACGVGQIQHFDSHDSFFAVR